MKRVRVILPALIMKDLLIILEKLLKVKQNMVFQKIFLFKQFKLGEGFQLVKMRPAFLVMTGECIVATWRENRATCNVHQVLFLFLGIHLLCSAEFLYAYQEQNPVHIRLDTIFFFKFYPELEPPYL